MALWQCDLRVSWRSQLFSLAVHGALILLILLAPWPNGWWVTWLLLVLLMVIESIRSQRRISARHGEISLVEPDRMLWRNQEWIIKQPVLMLDSGILLSLRRDKALSGSKRKRFFGNKAKLWLASDSMGQEEWRHLRQILLSGKRQDKKAHHHDEI